MQGNLYDYDTYREISDPDPDFILEKTNIYTKEYSDGKPIYHAYWYNGEYIPKEEYDKLLSRYTEVTDPDFKLQKTSLILPVK